ncbi:Membrane protein insertase YidC [Nitrospira tepida]|uniref:Membrane protein insertase YidC n=1 Tax=Nitrospira tepida TaxID=2973512 RepID=A0AA86T1Q2_9BACT|nr:membrane protein insertase YidC [Nitrospira tepida]CAI4030140.1 Membrane protein insertase YidC [Nitrospira tepida]
MERRVIIFLVLSLIIVAGYDYLLKQLGIVPSATEEAARQVDSSEKPSSTMEGQPAGPPATGSGAETKATGSEARTGDISPGGHESSAEQIVTIETDLLKVELTNKGGVIKTWQLKRYSTETQTGPQPVQLVYRGGQFPGPLSLRVSDEAATREMQQALYRVEETGLRLDPGHPTGRVTFTYRNPKSGLAIQKTLGFRHDSYLVDVEVKTEGVQGPVNVGMGTNFGIIEWGEGFIGLIGPASMVDDKIEKETPEQEAERSGTVQWAALQDKYFLSVIIPSQGTAVQVKKESERVVSSQVKVAPPAGQPVKLQLYAGPKEYDTLRSFQIGLEDTIDFGWFIYGSWSLVKMVAKPLFSVLRTINEVTHNYGVTIILLTVCIKLLFAPLQYKSYKSMKDMQVIQPKVLALQEKYKDDRERLNKELIKLYRDHKVNPVGGCLPMVLQMPVFVALFNILYMTIDLRQAPFFLWIKDLSVPDPFYVLPVIMGATMVLQQKMTPTTLDPTQAKVMLILPVMLTFLFLTFPAGLVLYWVTNNTLTIVQQFVTDRFIFKRPGPDKTAAAEAATQA